MSLNNKVTFYLNVKQSVNIKIISYIVRPNSVPEFFYKKTYKLVS